MTPGTTVGLGEVIKTFANSSPNYIPYIVILISIILGVRAVWARFAPHISKTMELLNRSLEHSLQMGMEERRLLQEVKEEIRREKSTRKRGGRVSGPRGSDDSE